MLDPYELLGVDPAAGTGEDARRAYFQLALLAHPDKGGAAGDMVALHAAYKHVAGQLAAAEEVRAGNAERVEAALGAAKPDAPFLPSELRITVPPSWAEVQAEAGEHAQGPGAAINAQLAAAFDDLLQQRRQDDGATGGGIDDAACGGIDEATGGSADANNARTGPAGLHEAHGPLLARGVGYGDRMLASEYAGLDPAAALPRYDPDLSALPELTHVFGPPQVDGHSGAGHQGGRQLVVWSGAGCALSCTDYADAFACPPAADEGALHPDAALGTAGLEARMAARLAQRDTERSAWLEPGANADARASFGAGPASDGPALALAWGAGAGARARATSGLGADAQGGDLQPRKNHST